MLTLTVGDGKTYSSIANALAAIPDPMTNNVTIERYEDAGGRIITTRQITIPANSMAVGKYTLTIKGMAGSMQTDDQIRLVTPTGDQAVFYVVSYLHYGLSFENLEIQGEGGTRAFFCNSAYAINFNFCKLLSEDQYAIYSYNGRNLICNDCVIQATNSYTMYASGTYTLFNNCTFISKTYINNRKTAYTAINCVFISTTASVL